MYSYVGNNSINGIDPSGRYGELVHGALTYHLALAAGFDERQAATIALNAARVDHDPETAPVSGENIKSGATKEWHFADQKATLSRVVKAIGDKDLVELGRRMHTLEDVGFEDAPGPHARGWQELQINGSGHGVGPTEEGKVSTPLNSWTDIPNQNPVANKKELMKIYVTLKSAAQQINGASAVSDDGYAEAKIDQLVGAETRREISEFLSQQGVDFATGQDVDSYLMKVVENYGNGGEMTEGVTWGNVDIAGEDTYE